MLGLRPLQLFSSSTAQYQLFPVAKKIGQLRLLLGITKKKEREERLQLFMGKKH